MVTQMLRILQEYVVRILPDYDDRSEQHRSASMQLAAMQGFAYVVEAHLRSEVQW